jgi:hypothetical protein
VRGGVVIGMGCRGVRVMGVGFGGGREGGEGNG